MKRILNVQTLSQREVPASLDARILGYARRKCAVSKALRRRKLLWFGSSAAAAACLALSTVFFWPVEERAQHSLRRAELLAMSDFTQVNQAGYNVSFVLDSGQDVVHNEF